MVPFGLKVPVDSGVVFPDGFLFHGVEPVTDFDARGRVADDQSRDPDSGWRLWNIRGSDLEPRDPNAKVWVSTEYKIRIAAEQRPVPPASTIPGLPPVIAFTGLMLVPYVDSSKCGPGNREVRCRGRLAFSLRATGMVAYRPDANSAVPGSARPANKAA
jgi:hypothetical protein